MLLSDGDCASLGVVDRGEVVGEGIDSIECTLLEWVLLDCLVVIAVLLLLNGELLHSGEVAVLLVLLAYLSLGGLPTLARFAVSEHLLLQSCQVDLL